MEALYKDLSAHVRSTFRMHGGFHSHSSLYRMESYAFPPFNFSPLTECLQPLCHRRNITSIAIF